MSIFAKPLSQVGTADLEELLKERAVEGVRLEFKLDVPSKEDTLKKLSSFANTFGGFMVIGARADSADGRLQELAGVDGVAGYKQKLVQWCFDAASPPLVVEVSDPIPAPAGDDKVCYVIYIAESDVAPHFLNGRKGIWVRTDEFSARFETGLANENELRHLFDRRKVIRERRVLLLERAKRRFDFYAARKHNDLSGKRPKVGALLEFCVIPRFPSQHLCKQEDLKAYVQKNPLVWRQGLFPDSGKPMFTQHESAIFPDAAKGTSILEVNAWGMVYYGARIDDDKVESGAFNIHLYQFVGKVLLFIRHAGTVLRAMGYSGPILVEISLASLQGVEWLHAPMGFAVARLGSELDDDVGFTIATTTQALQERPDGVAMDVLRSALFSANLSDLVDTQQELEELVCKGYRFNFWPEPVPADLKT